jgi:hypothetical protein
MVRRLERLGLVAADHYCNQYLTGRDRFWVIGFRQPLSPYGEAFELEKVNFLALESIRDEADLPLRMVEASGMPSGIERRSVLFVLTAMLQHGLQLEGAQS